jgi:hypothetical protein
MLSQKFAKDMQNEFEMNLKCRYLENYHSFWDFRYIKETKEFLFLKPSISEKRTSELSMWAQKNKWQTSLQNHFHGKPLNIFAKDLELFLLQK